MKHAGPQALAALDALLAALRQLPGLVERGPGRFYWRGQALLHFHEDPAGLFADLKTAPGQRGAGFTRLALTGPAEQAELLARVQALTAPPA